MKRILTVLLAFGLCVSASAASFTDTQTHWAKESIDYVTEKGLFKGTSDTTFSPELTTSRAMLCTVLYRYAGSPDISAENPFADVSDSSVFCDAIVWAAENGITQGYDASHFRPGATCTRGQMVLFLYRAFA